LFFDKDKVLRPRDDCHRPLLALASRNYVSTLSHSVIKYNSCIFSAISIVHTKRSSLLLEFVFCSRLLVVCFSSSRDVTVLSDSFSAVGQIFATYFPLSFNLWERFNLN